MLSARFLLSRPVRRTYKPGGTGAAGESSLGVSGVGTARLSLRRRPPKGGIENTIPRRLSSLTFTSTLGSQSKRATI
jgi:hypothetical protein